MNAMVVRNAGVPVEQNVARLEANFARLESDVGHLRSDLSDVKKDLRDQRATFETFRKDVADQFRAVWVAIDELRKELRGEIQQNRSELQASLNAVRAELKAEIGEMRAEIRALDLRVSKAMVWALFLYAGLAGSLFYVLARGFKWL